MLLALTYPSHHGYDLVLDAALMVFTGRGQRRSIAAFRFYCELEGPFMAYLLGKMFLSPVNILIVLEEDLFIYVFRLIRSSSHLGIVILKNDFSVHPSMDEHMNPAHSFVTRAFEHDFARDSVFVGKDSIGRRV